ncbi:MAG: hypothetical protein KC910_26120, partial [Candidatus Eremiobacteraeota bacterium]|nr:hypothetical protein [Candidatus Eremiobacteraeota bacterium]
ALASTSSPLLGVMNPAGYSPTTQLSPAMLARFETNVCLPEPTALDLTEILNQKCPDLKGRPAHQLAQFHCICKGLHQQGALDGDSPSLRQLVDTAHQAQAAISHGAEPLASAKEAALSNYPNNDQTRNLANFLFGQA